ncbi:unnamed protein product [Absidia cylindrospora]
MLDHDPSTSSDYTSTRYDLSLSNTTLSLSINVTSILSWVNNQLDEYIKHDKISSIHDLVADWEDGRAFLCLANRFYSFDNSDGTFESLLGEVDDKTDIVKLRTTLAFSVFERELGLTPPSTNPETPIPMYIAKVRHALLSLTPTDTDSNDPWTQRTQAVLDTIQHTRQQLQLLGFRPSSLRDDTLKRPDPFLVPDIVSSQAAHDDDEAHQNLTDMHHAEKDENNTPDERAGTTTTGWEEDLAMMEQLLLDLHRVLDEYHFWADDNMYHDDSGSDEFAIQAKINKRKALVQSVKNANNSFQEYLEHDQQVLDVFRKRTLFTQATAPIRQDLDWVQAEMLKTTTTDSGIKELEERVHHAGVLLDQLVQEHSEGDHQSNSDILQDMDQQYVNQDGSDLLQQRDIHGAEVDALVKKYRLVHSWVADVRIWFVEAQRIRQWIGERINILERKSVPDGVSSQDLFISADEVEDLNTQLETLEKEVALFDKEDLSRLRKHVKDLTVAKTKEKDLSPADTTTIEITFTTLMTLDQLKHLLNRHSYDLQILTLRVFWESEYSKTTDWVAAKANELGHFIKSQARWQDGPGDDDNGTGDNMVASTRSKSAIIDKLLEFEVEMSAFDQGQFTTTVNLYQELDDTSKVELPGFLESRQVDIEETFEALVHRVSFARRVVEQYLTMVDFMEASHRLLYTYMDRLYKRLVQQTDEVYTLFLDQQTSNRVGNNSSLTTTGDGKNNIHSTALDIQPLVDELGDIQDQAVRLITETAGLIPNTEAMDSQDQQENETGNDRVQLAVKSRSSELILFGESLEQQLNQYRQAIQWHTQLNTVYTNLQQLQNQITLDIHAASRLLQDLIAIFGDQALRISSTQIHDNNDNWDQHLQNCKHQLDIHQNDYEKMDDDIQHVLNLHTQASTTMSIATSDAVKYLQDGAKLVAAGLLKMKVVMDRWESGLCMMKDRQAWEGQYHDVTQWIAVHEQKCQHLRMESTWSPDEQETSSGHMVDMASALKQDWDEFKDRSLCPLKDAFDRLVGGLSSCSETKWVAQRQRQDSLLGRAGEVDDILDLVQALLEQRKAITLLCAGAQDLQSQGTRWLNLMEVSVRQRHVEKVSIDLDTFNTRVAELWKQWQSFDHDRFTRVTWNKHDDWGTLTDLNQYCDSVKDYASGQYHMLLSLAKSLEQWEIATDDIKGLRRDIEIWSDNIHSLSNQVVDIIDTMMMKKDTLLARLTVVYAMEKGASGTFEHDSGLDGTYQHLEDLDRLVQQWQDHEFDSLDANKLELEHRAKVLMKVLSELGFDGDGEELLDGLTGSASDLKRTRTQCGTLAKPLLSLVHQMVKTSDQRSTWCLEFMQLSSYSDQLQGYLQGVVLDKQNWIQNIITVYSTDVLQQLMERVSGIVLNIGTDDHQRLLDLENNSYAMMEQMYHDLSVFDLPDILHLPTVLLPAELQSRHTELQQSIPHLHLALKQLDIDVKWLGTGASWLTQVDGQLESWRILIDELVNFTDGDAKWAVVSNGKRKSYSDADDDIAAGGLLDLDVTLDDLCRRIDSLTNNVDVTLEELRNWESLQSNQECGVDDMGDLDGFKLWHQKARELETYRTDASTYLSYASNLVDHSKTLQKWYEQIISLKHHGNDAKSALLEENGSLGATELVHLVTTFDDNLTNLIDGTQNMNYPVPPTLSNIVTSINSNTHADDDDDDTDTIIHRYIHSRHEQLKETSASLHCILDAKEQSTRLKALVDGHVTKAMESLQWIKVTNEKLQQVVSGDISLCGLDLLESKLGIVHAVEKSKDLHASTYYHGLEESANSCLEAIRLATDSNERNGDDSSSMLQHELDRVTRIQQQVEVDWERLSGYLQQCGNDLKTALLQAERTYWGNQIMEKCKAIDDQLGSISDLSLNTVQDEQLNQWQHDINEIKSVDLHHLCNLFGPDSGENSENDSRLVLDDATNAHLQVENRIKQMHRDVQNKRQESKYSNLALDLIDYIDNTKTKSIELQDEFGQLPLVANIALDEAHYDQIKLLRDSIHANWTGYEKMCKQEGDLFLSTKGSLGDLGATTAMDQQHQQVMTGWTELQREIAKCDKFYHLTTQRRPILDTLHHASKILDDIDDSNDDDTKEQIDRIRRLMEDASNSMKLQQQSESSTMIKDDEKTKCVDMDGIYRKRFDALLDGVETVVQRMQERQKQRQIELLQQRYQAMDEKIKTSAEKELLALELPQPQDDSNIETNSGTAFYGQQYQQWAKQLESSEQTLQNLAQEAESMTDMVKSLVELGQTVVDDLVPMYQEPLNNLEKHIEQQQRLLALIRHILAHSKSADNITSWLEHFRTAVDEMAAAHELTTCIMDSDQGVEEDINDIEVKLQGFEPIMASLCSMNKTIQDSETLDDKENSAASQWKQLSQSRFDNVESLWNESVNALEMGKKMALKIQNATLLARKFKSLINMMGDSRDQIEQIQASLSTYGTLSADDDDHNQQNRPSLFKLIPRNQDLSSAYDKLEEIETYLTTEGQTRRLEIDQLIEEYHQDQQDNDNNANSFLQQRDEMDAAWTSIMDTINKAKHSLCDEKSVGKYLVMMDDIDVLLGSMDEVVLKASPQYHPTSTDSKYSKAELQAKLIELNARYDYYKLNIQQELQHADEYWTSTITNTVSTSQDFNRLKAVIIQHHSAQKARWKKLSDQQVPSRQLELKKAMASLGGIEKNTRLRKSSLPTRKAAATLTPHPQPLHSTTSSRLRPPNTISTGVHPSIALNGQQRLRTVSSSSSLSSQNKLQNRLRQSTSTTTSTSSISTTSAKSGSSLSTKTTRSTSSTFPGSKKKVAGNVVSRKPPNAYVAQRGNALDVEIGRIVNETPYQVKVKMVPGEVGRYWFGDDNPKLVYCRVLKSKMVMVRVGGGWAELSQFLRDHAKLEGEMIIPKQEDQHLLHTTMQEGYLETTTSLQRQRKQLMQDQMDQLKKHNSTSCEPTLTVPTPQISISSSSSSSSIPIRKISRSTSSNKSSSIQQNGYKDGDKFIAVDRHGKQLEVKMTRFSQRSALPTSTTNRRRKAVKP